MKFRLKFVKLIVLVGFILPVSAQKNIDIDFATAVDTIKDFLGGNKGPGEHPDYLNDLGIKFLRTHDIHRATDYYFYSTFWATDSAGNFVPNPRFDPDDPSCYNWATTDSLISSIISAGFEVYFRLGTSYPTSLYPEPYDPPVDNLSDSLSFTKFAELCKRTAMHYNGGWDDGFNYGIKYFEIWNEPGWLLFWTGTPLQYYKMFQAVCESLKSYDPSLKVGGPGAVPITTIGLNPSYRERFLDFLDTTDTPIDFYSWHMYGAKNPYSIKYFADTIRSLLDMHGFWDAEIHITEINHNMDSTLSTFVPSARGAAYYLSLVLTAQRAPIDLFLWYPAYAFSIGDTLNTQSANAIRAFHTMQTETPIIVASTGDEVVENSFYTDTTNFMILAAKSPDGNKLYILISNYNSTNRDYEIHLHNLPWHPEDDIEIRRNVIVDTVNFAEFVDTIPGDSAITITQTDMPAPSVLFLRLNKLPPTRVREHPDKTARISALPNPFNSQCIIYAPAGSIVEIYNLTGKLIKTLNTPPYVWSPDNTVPSGIYFARIKHRSGINERTIIMLIR